MRLCECQPWLGLRVLDHEGVILFSLPLDLKLSGKAPGVGVTSTVLSTDGMGRAVAAGAC